MNQVQTVKKNLLFVFDFDHTILNQNTDLWVLKVLNHPIPQNIQQSYEKGKWTEYMQRIFNYINEQNILVIDILKTMIKIPLTPGFAELFQLINNINQLQQYQIDCIIISDSNSLFIEWILQNYDLTDFFKKVYTNFGSLNNNCIIIKPLMEKHGCQKCPMNMCKKQVMNQFISNQKDNFIKYESIMYFGDGENDFCPAFSLSENDVVMARKDFPLEKKLINLTIQEVKPTLINWQDGYECEYYIKQKLKI